MYMACANQIRQEWIPRTRAEDQPRFQLVEDCNYANILGQSNKWLIVDLELKRPGEAGYFEYQKEEAELLREDTMGHLTAMVAEEIKEGSVGAVVTSDEAADGFYLVKWSGTPFTDQETGELLCEGKYFHRVGGTTKWYTPGTHVETIVVKFVVLADVVMEAVSGTNPLPRGCNQQQASLQGAMKISTESDDFIFDEIHRRDQLEDPEYGDG